jgi:hypothetical protein
MKSPINYKPQLAFLQVGALLSVFEFLTKPQWPW